VQKKIKLRTKIVNTPLQSKQTSKYALISRKTTFQTLQVCYTFSIPTNFPLNNFRTIMKISGCEKNYSIGCFFWKISISLSPAFRANPTQESQLLSKRHSTIMIQPNLLMYHCRVTKHMSTAVHRVVRAIPAFNGQQRYSTLCIPATPFAFPFVLTSINYVVSFNTD
jgi:hypothetical protein